VFVCDGIRAPYAFAWGSHKTDPSLLQYPLTMAASLTHTQLKSLEMTERVASCFSLVGTMFIFITFLSSPDFRKPINRLVFYASWGNTLCNVATLMSELPIAAGPSSHLCQFQGFLIQM